MLFYNEEKKLYDAVVTLLVKSSQRLSKPLSNGFERSMY